MLVKCLKIDLLMREYENKASTEISLVFEFYEKTAVCRTRELREI